MFGRKPPSSGVLSQRIRLISERPGASASSATALRNKPRAPRQALFRNATIETEAGERISVALKEISATGARIECIRRDALPDTFWLMEPMLKLARRVRIVWRKGGAVGVAFID
jgi:hypothetical protein